MTNPLNHPHQNQNSFQFKSADETRDKIMIYTKRKKKGARNRAEFLICSNKKKTVIFSYIQIK